MSGDTLDTNGQPTSGAPRGAGGTTPVGHGGRLAPCAPRRRNLALTPTSVRSRRPSRRAGP